MRVWAIGLTTVAVFGTQALGAQAATTIGQSPPTAGASFNCGPGTGVQVGVASGNAYTSGANGVITRWRTSANGSVALNVFTPGASPNFTATAESQLENAAGTLTTFNTRLPIVAGEKIGLRMPGATPGCLFQTADTADSIGVAGAAPIGVSTPFILTNPFRFNASADVEPDLDNDKFGDETQDLCPTDATTQGQCPDKTAPSAALTKTPKKKSKSRTATFKFGSNESGVSFQCAIDKKALKPCASPRKFKKLKFRKHKFTLVATDAAGNASASTIFRWRVVD